MANCGHNKKVLNSLVRKEKIIDGPTAVVLDLQGGTTAERSCSKEALEKVAADKFTSDSHHQQHLNAYVAQLRADTVDRVKDGAPLGLPSVDFFPQQLTRMADHSAPGPDGIPGGGTHPTLSRFICINIL